MDRFYIERHPQTSEDPETIWLTIVKDGRVYGYRVTEQQLFNLQSEIVKFLAKKTIGEAL